MAEGITACTDHSFSGTNCTVSSTDADDITTAISYDIPVTDILTTHDQGNNPIVASTTV